MIGRRRGAQDVLRSQTGDEQFQQTVMVLRRAAGVREEGIGRRFGGLDFGRGEPHGDDGRLKFDAPQALFQQSHEMFFVPGRLGERQVDGGRLDRLASAFVLRASRSRA